MPSSDTAMPRRRAVLPAGYLLAALLAGAEIVVLGLALNPRVHPDYRAFYIDRTNTCLNRDRIGSFNLGETVSFRHLEGQSERMKRAEGVKVCGWTGPAGDGTHSLGETSRLRVKVTGGRGGLKSRETASTEAFSLFRFVTVFPRRISAERRGIAYRPRSTKVTIEVHR